MSHRFHHFGAAKNLPHKMGKWIIQALRHGVKDERIHSTHFIHTIAFQVRYPTSISKELPTKNYRKKTQPSHNNQAHNDG